MPGTSTKTRKRASRRVPRVLKEDPKQRPDPPEPTQEPQEENIRLSTIQRVYLRKVTGLEVVEWPDAEEHIKAIQALGEDDRPFIFYEQDGSPVYMANMNGTYQAPTFPPPGKEETQAGMTSMELYSYAITLAQAIEKIIELETQPKPSLLDQAKKIMTPTIAIVACVFVIFLMVVVIQG